MKLCEYPEDKWHIRFFIEKTICWVYKIYKTIYIVYILLRMVNMENKKTLIGEGIGFERIRRITGYLVGTLDRFNDGKKAEVRDRVKHKLAESCSCVVEKAA